MSKKLKYAARLAVSLAVIVALFWVTELEGLPKLQNIDPAYLVAAVLAVFSDRLINAYKWKVLVSPVGIKSKFYDILKIYLTSSFVGLVIPSGIGGEVLKGYSLARSTSEATDSASSVVVDRICGLFGLSVVCILGYYLGPENIKNKTVSSHIKNISIVILSVIFVSAYLGSNLPDTLVDESESHWITIKFSKIHKSLYKYRDEKSLLVWAIVLSIAIHLIRIYALIFLSYGFGIQIPQEYFFVFVPFVQLGGVVPVTLGGVGAEEGIAVYLFSVVGVSSGAILGIFVVLRVITIMSVCPGGWFYFREGFRLKDGNHNSSESQQVPE